MPVYNIENNIEWLNEEWWAYRADKPDCHGIVRVQRESYPPPGNPYAFISIFDRPSIFYIMMKLIRDYGLMT